MKIKMVVDAKGSANESGNATMMYKKDDIIDCDQDWKVNLGQIFLDNDLAIEVKVDTPKETKTKKKTVKKKATKKKG